MMAVTLLVATPDTAWGRNRVVHPSHIRVGTGAQRGARLIRALVDNGLVTVPVRSDRVAVRLSAHRGPLLHRPDIEVLEVRATLDGVPLDAPLVRALVDSAGAGAVRLVTIGAVLPELLPPDRHQPVFGADEALARLTASRIKGAVGAHRAELVARIRAGAFVLAWRVRPPPDPVTLSRRTFFVDAQTLAIAAGPNRTLRARARAFEHNPVVDAGPAEFDLNFVDKPATELVGPYYRVLNCVAPTQGPTCAFAQVLADDGGDFMFVAPDVSIPADNKQPEDRFAAASIYYHADKFHRFVSELGLEGLPCHAQGERATLVANYKVYDADGWISIDNAAYVGDCELTAVFGQGPGADWGYDGDVIYHELTHGLIEQMMGPPRFLGRAGWRPEAVVVDAGAIGEGIADFVAAALSGDPVHGDYVAAFGGGQGRDAANDLACPQALTGEIHFDSEPFAGALWAAYRDIGDPLVPAVIDAVAMFPEDVSFEEAAAIITAVTSAELGADAAGRLAQVFATRRLDDCERIVAWDELERPMWLVPKSTNGSYDPMRPPPVQLAVEVPSDVDTMRVDFGIKVLPTPGWDPVGDVHVLVQHGSAVRFAYTQDPRKDVVRVEATPDEHIPSINDGSFEVEVLPRSSVYLAFFNLGVHVAVISDIEVSYEQRGTGETGVSAQSGERASGTMGRTGTTGATQTTEAGHPPQADHASATGCSCHASSDRPTPWNSGSAALVVLLCFRGRRRRPTPTRRCAR